MSKNYYLQKKRKRKTRLTWQTSGRIYNNRTLRTLTSFQCTIMLRTGTSPQSQSLKVIPNFSFLWNKEIKKIIKKQNKNTALRDKSAQNCATPHVKNTDNCPTLLFEIAARFQLGATYSHLSTTDLFKVKVQEIKKKKTSPFEMFTGYEHQNHGVKMLMLFDVSS